MTTVLHIPARPDAAIACDMSTAQDTPAERLADYARLFERALTGRERRDDGVVLTFSRDAREDVEDLVRREAACCSFVDYRVDLSGGDVVWTTTNPRRGDDRADADVILDALYELPDHAGAGLDGYFERLAERGREAHGRHPAR
ncbi:MAG TPA: hypothetical protein VFX51_30115 [Solirubrobacteraceae bacterium]|nr:hypothetical protein [Solirubrobacteraceae bacterium]